MVNLHEFLALTKKLAPKVEELMCAHIIMGNESCDLDSMVSAMVLALFYKNTKYRYSDIKAIPVMNCLKEDFALRTENNYILEKYKIDKNNLIFRDEVNLMNLAGKEMMRLTLVDHHVLSKNDMKLKDSVREIFDHRPLDRTVVWPTDVNIVNQLVASCCTIIGKEMLSTYSQCLCTAASLIYETIVFDTIGFNPKAEKATPLDFEMADTLEQLLDIQTTRLDLFDELWKAHNNVSLLTSRQLLLKDLKILDNVHVPGLPMLVEMFLQRDNAIEAMTSYSTENNVVLVVMGLEADGEVKRDLVLFGNAKNTVLGTIREKLLLNEELDLEEVEKYMPNLTYYRQRNVKVSRKAIIPIIKDCLKTYNATTENTSKGN